MTLIKKNINRGKKTGFQRDTFPKIFQDNLRIQLKHNISSVLIPPLPVFLFAWRLKHQRLLRSPGHQQPLALLLHPRHLTEKCQHDKGILVFMERKEKQK